MRGNVIPAAQLDPVAVGRMLREMESEALALVRTVGIAGAAIDVERMVAMRYAGQSFELGVPLPDGSLRASQFARVMALFAESYRQRYHAPGQDTPVEFVRWHVRVTARQEPIELRTNRSRRKLKDAVKGKRYAYIPERASFAACTVYDRDALPSSCSFTGPAIIEEIESTVFVGHGAAIRVDGDGDIAVTRPRRGRRSP